MRVNALGAALKHIGDNVFTSDSGMRRNVPKVLVAVTDGRSQDDVKKSALKLQHAGNTEIKITLFFCMKCVVRFFFFGGGIFFNFSEFLI